MNSQIKKQEQRKRRQIKIRSKIKGTNECPRLNIFKSNKGTYLQIINDLEGKTLISAHSKEIKGEKKKTEIDFKLGKLIAKKALDKKIKKIVFDRGGYKYHGRIKSVADGAREGGLKF